MSVSLTGVTVLQNSKLWSVNCTVSTEDLKWKGKKYRKQKRKLEMEWVEQLIHQTLLGAKREHFRAGGLRL